MTRNFIKFGFKWPLNLLKDDIFDYVDINFILKNTKVCYAIFFVNCVVCNQGECVQNSVPCESKLIIHSINSQLLLKKTGDVYG